MCKKRIWTSSVCSESERGEAKITRPIGSPSSWKVGAQHESGRRRRRRFIAVSVYGCCARPQTSHAGESGRSDWVAVKSKLDAVNTKWNDKMCHLRWVCSGLVCESKCAIRRSSFLMLALGHTICLAELVVNTWGYAQCDAWLIWA